MRHKNEQMIKPDTKHLRKIPTGSPLRCAKYRWGIKILRYSTNNSLYLANDTRWRHSYYGTLIGTRMRSIKSQPGKSIYHMYVTAVHASSFFYSKPIRFSCNIQCLSLKSTELLRIQVFLINFWQLAGKHENRPVIRKIRCIPLLNVG